MFIDTLHDRLKLYFFEGENAGAGGTGEPKLSSGDALNKAITDATTKVAADTKPEDKKEEVKVEDKKSETKVEDKKEEEKDEFTEEQLKYAKTLFKALSSPDPKVQKATLELFAKTAGLELKEIETKKEVVEAKEALVDLLKAGLGEYDWLADKIAPALEKALGKLVEDKTKDIREEVRLSKEEKFKDHVSISLDKAFDHYSNALEVKAEFLKLTEDRPKPEKITYEEHYKDLLVLAANRKGITLKVKGSDKSEDKDKTKEDKNRNDAGSRIASDRTAEVKEGVRSSQRKGLDKSVREAVEETLKKMNA